MARSGRGSDGGFTGRGDVGARLTDVVSSSSYPDVADRAALLPVTLGAGGRFRRDWLRRRLLAGADVAAVAVAALILIAFGTSHTFALEVLAFIPGWLLVAKLCGLYDRDHRTLRHMTLDEAPWIAGMTLGGSAALIAILAVLRVHPPEIGEQLGLWVAIALCVTVGRSVVRLFFRNLLPPERTLVIGQTTLAQAVRRKLQLLPDLNVQIVRELRRSDADHLVEGSPLLAGIERVIVALPTPDEELLSRLLRIGRAQEIKVSVVPPVRALLGTAVQLTHVADLPMIEYHTWDTSRTTMLAKRSLDVCLSLALIVLLSPLMLAVAVAVWICDGRPVLFSQERAGFRGEPFRMLKYRTMRTGAQSSAPLGLKLRNDPRITRLGRILRQTSLDELPQLINVLRGEMSLVGPRPEQVELVALYTPDQLFRLNVRPGLTGPMQVHGRGALDLEERLSLERDYVENVSLARDLRILGLTIGSVVRRNGAF